MSINAAVKKPKGVPSPRQGISGQHKGVRIVSQADLYEFGVVDVIVLIGRYRKHRKTQTTRRARFGLALSTCSVLSKRRRVVVLSGRSVLSERKPRSACRISPITSAGL